MMTAVIETATATAIGAHQEAQGEPESSRELVWTIDLDGRPLQVVTEWWKHQPATRKTRLDPETGEWVGQQIYCPTTGRTFFPAS